MSLPPPGNADLDIGTPPFLPDPLAIDPWLQDSGTSELPLALAASETPVLRSLIEAYVEPFREAITASPDGTLAPVPVEQGTTFGRYLRESGSLLVHDTVDAILELSSSLPELLREIETVSRYLGVPPPTAEGHSGDDTQAMGTYEAVASQVHGLIDRAFSTEQAHRYTGEAKTNCSIAIGLIPPPVFGTNGKPLIGRLAPTQASWVCGWKVGDPINNLTRMGRVPKWSTVRKRYWKNMALNRSQNYSASQLPRMRKGLAPQRFNKATGRWESMELHHVPPQRDGGLFDFLEMWPDQHAEADPMRFLGGR